MTVAWFPRLAARDLDGREVALPAGLPGEWTVVIIAFRREQQELVDSWVPWLDQLAAAEPRLGFAELPAIGLQWQPARPVIDGGMAAAIRDQKTRRRTLTVYTDIRRVTVPLGIPTGTRSGCSWWTRPARLAVGAGHATIARFRVRHETALGGLFSQVLRLLAAEGMVALGLLSLDGTKLAGNASQKANKTLPQIEKLLAEAAKVDAAEDAEQGGSPQPVTPRALARRAERRERLAAAAGRLAAEDQARRDAQRAKVDAWQAAAAARKPRGHRPGDEPPRPNRNNTEPRANITDPDVRVMRNQKGYVAGYNGQLVVTGQQVIVGAMLAQHPVDRTLLHPLLDRCRDQLAAAAIRPKLRTVLADSGYVSEETFARAHAEGLRLLAPLAKDPGRRYARTPQRPLHLDRLPATARARRRLLHPRGRDDYKLRARTVEPVFGQLKTCQKLTMMSRRGLAACENEWLLVCAAHNLRKLHRHRTQG